jgi:hypothetical protein
MHMAMSSRLAATGLALGVLAAASLPAAAVAMPTVRTGPPSLTPAVGTPALALNTKTPEQIRQLAQCGNRMYAVGSFTKITQRGRSIFRQNVFSFRATAPYTVTSWHPRVNGVVNSIAFLNKHCNRVFLGGDFTKVGKHKKKNIVELSTHKAFVVSRFKAKPNLVIQTLLMWHKHLLTGGFFTTMNGSSKHKYFASLRPTTGKDDGYLSLKISGNYHYVSPHGVVAVENPTRVFNQQLSHNGKRLLVEGDFKKIGGRHRQQVAMLNLNTHHARVSRWYPKEFNRHCAANQPFYAKAGSWSANDKQVFIAAGGGAPNAGTGFLASQPRGGLCDAASAFPVRQHAVTHQWINYTGCDALFATVADKNNVYIAGHERWASNKAGCNKKGTGAVDADGMGGLSPRNGTLTYSPSRSRGFGADDMILTHAGLWVASDNFEGADQCGGAVGHSGICFLPY